MSRRVLVVLFFALLASRSTAAALDGVRTSLTQVPGKRLAYELRFESARSGPIELDFDPRRLKVTITGPEGRIRHVCRHRQGPLEAVEKRRIVLKDEGELWAQRIDLADYCYPEALETLQEGATIEATFGEGSVTRTSVFSDVEALGKTRVSAVVPPSRAQEEIIQVRLRATKAKTPDTLRFRLSLRTTRGAHWVYPRLDLWRFRVQGPSGLRECAPRRDRIVPIVDFYHRVSPGRPVRQTLMASYACPGVFEEPGVYEVTPIIDLVYSSPRNARRAITGTFQGPASRVTLQGARRGSKAATAGK